MQINFTGIKNIGYEKSSIDYTRPDFPTEIKDYLGVDENMLETSWHWLNVELKDDYNGKHLSDYKKAMKNSGLNIDDFSNPINKNFLPPKENQSTKDLLFSSTLSKILLLMLYIGNISLLYSLKLL